MVWQGISWLNGLKLVLGVLLVQLIEREDKFVWNADKSFSVKSMYNSLMRGTGVPSQCETSNSIKN
jgi:hypothetical protein